MGVALELKRVIETNLIRVSYHCISCYFCFNISFKQLYTSSETECFSYKGGCGGRISRCLKEEAVDKWFCVICYLKQLYN